MLLLGVSCVSKLHTMCTEGMRSASAVLSGLKDRLHINETQLPSACSR